MNASNVNSSLQQQLSTFLRKKYKDKIVKLWPLLAFLSLLFVSNDDFSTALRYLYE